MKKIGEVAQELNISVDTLRYYEKIKLLTNIHRNSSGVRGYQSEDLKKIIFIKQSQHVGFSLEEISQLLQFRDSPAKTKPFVREVVSEKLAEIELRIKELTALHSEFTQLIQQCVKSDGDCPILKQLEKNTHL